jgi:hypothetical protein
LGGKAAMKKTVAGATVCSD